MVCSIFRFFSIYYFLIKKGIYGELEIKVAYKLYITYLINLFAKFIENTEIEQLLHIYKIINDENLLFGRKIAFSITYDLKVAIFKMASVKYKFSTFF